MKASEVFDLPVASGGRCHDADDIFQADGDGVWCATFCSDEQAKVAVNCINHADALADALAVCVGIIGNSQWWRDDDNEAYQDARNALAAYRGAK